MTHDTTSPDTTRRIPLWRRVITCVLSAVVILCLATIIAVGSAVWWLAPERLTPLVNGFLSSYLDADVSTSRVELTFWSTFPHVELSVDSLSVISRRFRSLPEKVRTSLPTDADSLLSLDRFSGGIHIVKLMHGEICLYDIELANPKANMVIAANSTANFDIIPPSKPSTEPTTIPRLSINRFAITGSFPIRYRSLPDSIDLRLRMNATELSGTHAPIYTLSIAGGANPGLPHYKLPHIPFSINGHIGWNQDTPQQLKLSDIGLSVLGNDMHINADLSFANPLTLNQCEITIPDIQPGPLLRLLAPDNPALAPLHTDLTLHLHARLLKPYSPTVSELPRIAVDAVLQASKVEYQQLNLSALEANIHTRIDDADLNRSTVDVRRLYVAGRAINVTLSGTLTDLLTDPGINGSFRGSVALDRLPATLTSKLPCSLSGTLAGQATYSLRKSMLTPKRLHRVRLNGYLTLDDCNIATIRSTDHARAYLTHARLDLGTDSHRTVGDHIIDSLFTASLTVDSISVEGPGLLAHARGLQANLGSRNVAASTDTAQINPFGGSIAAEYLTLHADSGRTRVRLTDVKAGGALMRYLSQARSPRVEMSLQAGRLGVISPGVRTVISDANVRMSFHPRGRRPLPPEVQSRYDSLANLYPHLPTDSLRAMARRELRRSRPIDTNPNSRESIDFNLDNSLASWLRLWQLSGTIKAQKGRFFTPHFPIRNRITNLDIDFSTDSVFIRDTRVKSGHSDFIINGSVRDITRALTSRSRRVPLVIDLDVKSDSIDINELSATLMRGEAYNHEPHHHRSTLTRLIDEEIDIAEDYIDISIEEPPTRAILVPSNIKANVRVQADNIQYTDLLLHNFYGHIGIFDGAVDLDHFRADTDIGSIQLTALYSAPTRTQLQFAAGLQLHRLQLHQVLDMLPHIDSLMPMLKSVSGVVDASVALTTGIDSTMNVDLQSMDVAVRLTGDSLVLLDSETFRTIAKWMMFKNKHRNMIDHMDVEVIVRDGEVNLYPVIVDMDRYKIGVYGTSDLDMNLDYHVAVLKSPLPFRFGVNIKGSPDHLKIRLGKARFDEKEVASRVPIADTIRVNLLSEMHRLFTDGIRASGVTGLRAAMGRTSVPAGTPAESTSSSNLVESMLELIRRGVIFTDTPHTIDPSRQHKLKEAARAARRLAHSE